MVDVVVLELLELVELVLDELELVLLVELVVLELEVVVLVLLVDDVVLELDEVVLLVVELDVNVVWVVEDEDDVLLELELVELVLVVLELVELVVVELDEVVLDVLELLVLDEVVELVVVVLVRLTGRLPQRCLHICSMGAATRTHIPATQHFVLVPFPATNVALSVPLIHLIDGRLPQRCFPVLHPQHFVDDYLHIQQHGRHTILFIKTRPTHSAVANYHIRVGENLKLPDPTNNMLFLFARGVAALTVVRCHDDSMELLAILV